MWKVYVGNLDSRVKERELADEFRGYGNVRSVWVARNPPGYAFVEFDDRRDAEDSVSALDVLENKAVMERKPPPLEYVIVANVGKHGWRVEMSRKSVGGGGRSRASHGNESRCYDCGGVGHFARECRSRGSRHSRRRSPSPLSRRSDSHRHSLSRSGRDGSRSPRRDRSNSYRDRSSPRRKRERSRSLDSDISEGRGHRAKGRRHSISPQHGKSDALSPRREDNELSRSPQNDPETKEHELSRSPQNGGSDTREASPGVKGDEGSKSPPSERSGQLGDLQKEGYEQNGTPQGEESDMEGDGSPVLREDSRSPRPDNADGPIRNGSAGSRSPQEDNNTSYPDRSPAEELVEEHCNGDSD